MSSWDELLKRTNSANQKEEYIKNVEKQNEEYYWDKRYEKAKDEFNKTFILKELQKIFDLHKAIGGQRYWKGYYGKPEENIEWKDLCPDSRYSEESADDDLNRIGIGTRHASGPSASTPCLRMRIGGNEWKINIAYVEAELFLYNDKIAWNRRVQLKHGDDWAKYDFRALPEKKKDAIIFERFVEAYPTFVKQFERMVTNEIRKKEECLENVEIPDSHFESEQSEDILSTFETYCIKDGISYSMNEAGNELYAINNSLSDHDINVLLNGAINKHQYDAGDQVYLYADDNELHYHLEELFDQYLECSDDFEYISEEFESGLEQYQEEIGNAEMEL